MKLHIELYGGLKQRVGSSQLTLELSGERDWTVEEALGVLQEEYPALRGGLDSAAVAIEAELVGRDHKVELPMTLGLLPPVSGG